jgi:hypothetical protein
LAAIVADGWRNSEDVQDSDTRGPLCDFGAKVGLPEELNRRNRVRHNQTGFAVFAIKSRTVVLDDDV